MYMFNCLVKYEYTYRYMKQILIRYLVTQIAVTDLRVAVLVFGRRLALHPARAMPGHLLQHHNCISSTNRWCATIQ